MYAVILRATVGKLDQQYSEAIERMKQLGLLGIFRPKKTKIATARASSGFQKGVTFFEDFEFHCFEAQESMTYGGYVRFGRKIPSTPCTEIFAR